MPVTRRRSGTVLRRLAHPQREAPDVAEIPTEVRCQAAKSGAAQQHDAGIERRDEPGPVAFDHQRVLAVVENSGIDLAGAQSRMRFLARAPVVLSTAIEELGDIPKNQRIVIEVEDLIAASR